MDRLGRGRLVLAVGAFGALVLSACGTTDPASSQTLPPIRPTVATTSTTTTTIPEGERYYTVQSGDTLGKIAESYKVPVQAIVDLNGLESPDAIQAGQTLQIPSGVVVETELPTGPATGTSAP